MTQPRTYPMIDRVEWLLICARANEEAARYYGRLVEERRRAELGVAELRRIWEAE